MKNLILISIFALSMNTAQAAQKYKKIEAATHSNSTAMSYNTQQDSGFKFEARPGFGTSASNFTWGINLEGKYGFKISGNTLFVGLETGFFRTGLGSNDFESYVINSIPITPSATFEFAVSNKIKLYGGASVGLAIGTLSHSISNNNDFGFGAAQGTSNTQTAFMWKFRPGMVLNDQFVAELPIGTTDGSFYFMPNVGMRF